MGGADEDWAEAGAKKKAPVAPAEKPFVVETNPANDPEYMKLLTKLQGYHTELLKLDNKLVDNPVLAGEYQGKLRLAVNRLFAWKNAYIDLVAEITESYATERQKLYKEHLLIKNSPSAADKHAGETTRQMAANLAIAKLRVDQIDNEYERYNGIAIYLASRMKEFNTERMMQ